LKKVSKTSINWGIERKDIKFDRQERHFFERTWGEKKKTAPKKRGSVLSRGAQASAGQRREASDLGRFGGKKKAKIVDFWVLPGKYEPRNVFEKKKKGLDPLFAFRRGGDEEEQKARWSGSFSSLRSNLPRQLPGRLLQRTRRESEKGREKPSSVNSGWGEDHGASSIAPVEGGFSKLGKEIGPGASRWRSEGRSLASKALCSR